MIMNFKSPSCGWCGITSPPQLAACLSIASFLSEDILLLRSYLARFVLIHMHQKRWTVPSRSRHTLCESHEVFRQQRVNLCRPCIKAQGRFADQHEPIIRSRTPRRRRGE